MYTTSFLFFCSLFVIGTYSDTTNYAYISRHSTTEEVNGVVQLDAQGVAYKGDRLPSKLKSTFASYGGNPSHIYYYDSSSYPWVEETAEDAGSQLSPVVTPQGKTNAQLLNEFQSCVNTDTISCSKAFFGRLNADLSQWYKWYTQKTTDLTTYEGYHFFYMLTTTNHDNNEQSRKIDARSTRVMRGFKNYKCILPSPSGWNGAASSRIYFVGDKACDGCTEQDVVMRRTSNGFLDDYGFSGAGQQEALSANSYWSVVASHMDSWSSTETLIGCKHDTSSNVTKFIYVRDNSPSTIHQLTRSPSGSGDSWNEVTVSSSNAALTSFSFGGVVYTVYHDGKIQAGSGSKVSISSHSIFGNMNSHFHGGFYAYYESWKSRLRVTWGIYSQTISGNTWSSLDDNINGIKTFSVETIYQCNHCTPLQVIS